MEKYGTGEPAADGGESGREESQEQQNANAQLHLSEDTEMNREEFRSAKHFMSGTARIRAGTF